MQEDDTTIGAPAPDQTTTKDHTSYAAWTVWV
jgi:hypothetical protein